MIALISHPVCFQHEIGDGHPEQPDRIRVIDQALKSADFAPELKEYIAPKATLEQLQRVHDKDYIKHIFQVAPKQGYVDLDMDTTMNPYTLDAALHAAGAVILAVDKVMSGEVNAAFCNVRPPGHHAEHDRAMGFCFFDNIAVGVAHALERHNLQRIAIIDFDVHHGNGTEDIFSQDPRVLICSSFQHPFYPHSGAYTKSAHILNLPLPAGTDGAVFRKKVEEYWLPALIKFKPDFIFFSAGFDAHAEDPLANFKFQNTDYFWVTQEIKKIADAVCQGRIVSSLEGGYNLEVLGESAVAHVRGLKNN